MRTPKFDDVQEHPLDSDEEVLERVTELLRTGLRQQLWLMFLDASNHQLPLLIPTDVPHKPGMQTARDMASFLQDVMERIAATSVVVTLERRGADTIGDDDREWFRLVRDAADMAEVRLRGPLLCHNAGVRWVAAEDYAIT